MHAEVLDGQAWWQGVLRQRAGRFGDEDLTAVGGAGDPGGSMDLEPQILIADQRCLAGVQTNPHPHLPAVGPPIIRQRLLDCGRAGAGIERAVEDDKERIALGTELVAVIRLQRLPLDGVMRQQHLGIAIAELLDQPRRSLDITEIEGDGAGRQLAHAAAPEWVKTGSRTDRSWRSYSERSKSSSGSGGIKCSPIDPFRRR